MFDIGFWELVVVLLVGLVVLGPDRLPGAIRTVTRWVKGVRNMADNVKDEISQELKLHELQENLKKAEQTGMKDLAPEVQESIDSLKQAAADVQRPYAPQSHTNTAEKLETSDKK